MNLLRAFAAAALSAFAMISLAAESGLVLDFRQASGGVDLDNASTARYVETSASGDAGAWTVAIESPAHVTLWSKQIRAPRAFHAAPGSDLRFSVVIPRPEPGAIVSLRDEHRAILWKTDIDDALLAKADQQGAQAKRALARSVITTQSLLQMTAGDRPLPLTETGHGREPVRQDLPEEKSGSAKSASASPVFNVSGHVAVRQPIIVRVYDAASGQFVLSTEQNWATSRFDIPLPAGKYIFEADDNLENVDHPLFYRRPTQTSPILISSDTTLPDIVPDDTHGSFLVNALLPCSTSAPALQFGLTATSADGAYIERLVRTDDAPLPQNGGRCAAQYRVDLSPGIYDFDFSPSGWPREHLSGISIEANANVEHTSRFDERDQSLIWSGRVVDEDGNRVPYPLIILSDNVFDGTNWVFGDEDGRFRVPFRDGDAADISYGIDEDLFYRRSVVRIGATPPTTVAIRTPRFLSENADGLLHFYGSGDRANTFNILFLSDGYAGVHETYTDRNGNGQWDGFAWYDIDRDGVMSDNDRISIYGKPTIFWPPNGSNPSDYSEPFDDQNEDGILSTDDAALFLRDARAFMYTLLGADVWNEHQAAFNAYALFEPSPQAGYNVASESGVSIIERRTNYATTLTQGRNLMSADRELLMHHALAAMPDLDLVVLLINEPVYDFSRGNVTVGQPGSMLLTSKSFIGQNGTDTAAHEMGHFVGSLCDEYSEFIGVHPQAGSKGIWCPNASYSADPADIPWASWISSSTSIPTRNMGKGIGVYEGADYYSTGAYRPSFTSIMRDLQTPTFNAPSRAALEAAINRRVSSRPPASHSRHAIPASYLRRN